MEKRLEEISTISSYLFCVWKDDSTKTRIQIPARQYCGPLRIRRQRWTAGRRFPAAALNLSSGNAGSCCKGWYPCFCDGLSYFLRICRIRFASPAPGEREGKSGACIQGFLISFCQSCIPAGIIAIYMTEGNRILPWSFRISFSIHLYCISTPFSQPSLKISL